MLVSEVTHVVEALVLWFALPTTPDGVLVQHQDGERLCAS